jgi:hypothetical protein
MNPAIAILPSCFPRGLPIQEVTRYIDTAVNSTAHMTPYVYSCTQNFFFQKSEVALLSIAKNKETRNAIGTFVNGYAEALRLYVLQSPTSEVLQNTMLAWKHALIEFSKGKLSLNEAHRT